MRALDRLDYAHSLVLRRLLIERLYQSDVADELGVTTRTGQRYLAEGLVGHLARIRPLQS
jgi:hypothetical protein